MSLSLNTRDNFLTMAKLLQRLHCNFFEKDDVVVAVILQPKPTFDGTSATLRFEIKLLVGNGLSFGVVRNLDAIDFDEGMRTIKGDDHGVPLGTGFSGEGQRLG